MRKKRQAEGDADTLPLRKAKGASSTIQVQKDETPLPPPSKEWFTETAAFQRKLEQVVGELERATSATKGLAYSIDGMTFSYEAPVLASLMVGSYVILRSEDGVHYLGRITSRQVALREGPEYGLKMTAEGDLVISNVVSESNFVQRATARCVRGDGEILAKVLEHGQTPPTREDVFERAEISTASPEHPALYLRSSQGSAHVLDIGNALNVTGTARVLLRADAFNRHTFLCGQSGSGKTFALGVILEQLLLHTGLRVIILDPNSDFVRLHSLLSLKNINRTRSSKLSKEDYQTTKALYKALRLRLRVVRPVHLKRNVHLQFRLSDLEQSEQAAVLQLHPINDRAEYNNFLSILERLAKDTPHYAWSHINERIVGDLTPEARQLGLRILNLGIAGWEIWCKEGPSLTDQLKNDWRCMVVDLGPLGSPEEKSVAAMAILGHYWRHRNPEAPILIVIDEAHNICPAEPATSLENISKDYLVRIAGEGRKFGLHLLLASQRPGKIHSNVLTQCDNLILMRMNSRSDLSYLEETFSQVQNSLLACSRSFVTGESLLTGKIVPSTTFAKFEGRLSHEGGRDPEISWANDSSHERESVLGRKPRAVGRS
jgi:uncharacterized protein